VTKFKDFGGISGKITDNTIDLGDCNFDHHDGAGSLDK
jgi:hypothetical protein